MAVYSICTAFCKLSEISCNGLINIEMVIRWIFTKPYGGTVELKREGYVSLCD